MTWGRSYIPRWAWIRLSPTKVCPSTPPPCKLKEKVCGSGDSHSYLLWWSVMIPPSPNLIIGETWSSNRNHKWTRYPWRIWDHQTVSAVRSKIFITSFTESYWLRLSFNIKVPQDSNACLVERCSVGYTKSSLPVWRRRRGGGRGREYTFLLYQWLMMSLPSQLLCHVEEYWDQQQPAWLFPKHSKASLIWNLVYHSLSRRRFAEFGGLRQRSKQYLLLLRYMVAALPVWQREKRKKNPSVDRWWVFPLSCHIMFIAQFVVLEAIRGCHLGKSEIENS